MLPESVEEIYLLTSFNQQVNNLPRGFEVLTLSNSLQYPISNIQR